MKSPDRKKRAAFTLVELIVVIGLMGMLATVSVAGYNAASTGMKNRAVIQDVTSLMRQAMQTAAIEKTVTAVLMYNRKWSEDKNGLATGYAVAIRQAGHITLIKNNILVDEFADWQASCSTESVQQQRDPGMRFYRMTDVGQLEKGRDGCSSLMVTTVQAVQLDDYMIARGTDIRNWANQNRKTAQDNAKTTYTSLSYANNYVWGHAFKSQNGINWNVGDAYGVEFASLQLPDGFFFGSSRPSEQGDSTAKGVSCVIFYPGKVKSDGSIPMSQRPSVAKGDGKDWIMTISDAMLTD